MKNLEDTVNSVVQDFLNKNELFTALDISNMVKETMPFARHREIRDLVRGLFTSEIESKGYGRTTIQVSLDDGSTANALLYHPLADSWDLDSKYDAQKRAQSTSPQPATKTTTSPAVTSNVAPAVTVQVTPPLPSSPRDLWAKLFDTQKSIFPRA